eukprot:gene229-biopygen932
MMRDAFINDHDERFGPASGMSGCRSLPHAYGPSDGSVGTLRRRFRRRGPSEARREASSERSIGDSVGSRRTGPSEARRKALSEWPVGNRWTGPSEGRRKAMSGPSEVPPEFVGRLRRTSVGRLRPSAPSQGVPDFLLICCPRLPGDRAPMSTCDRSPGSTGYRTPTPTGDRTSIPTRDTTPMLTGGRWGHVTNAHWGHVSVDSLTDSARIGFAQLTTMHRPHVKQHELPLPRLCGNPSSTAAEGVFC